MSSSTPQPAPPPEDSSYTKMDTTDLESIGAHCQFPYCHQLDFLPFRCDSCKSTFCLDHRSETAHKCTHAGAWAKNKRKNSVGTPNSTGLSGPTLSGLNPAQCSEAQCKTIINTLQNIGSRCNDCHRQYCLPHRFRDAHDCANMANSSPSPGARPPPLSAQQLLETQATKMRASFSRLRTWTKQKQSTLTPTRPSSSPSPSPSPSTTLATLKRNAKGDTTLPTEKRIYVHVEAEASSTTAKLPQADLFFSAEWSVGRVLDEAARRLQVENVNHRVEGEQDRLRVYHVEGGRVLPFQEKLALGSGAGAGGGRGVRSGDTLVLLRGVGGE